MSSAIVNANQNFSIGYCGKIPSKGDFIHADLSQDFTDIWNEWLQSIIGVSREQLADNWLTDYLISPIWNFSLSAGIAGKQTMCGVVLPSVDKVGRYFPFTIAHQAFDNPVAMAFENSDWFNTLNELALSALDPAEFDLNNFCQTLSLLNAEQETSESIAHHSVIGKAIPGRKLSWYLEGEFNQENMTNINQLLHLSWSKLFGSYSLWWTNGSEKVAPCLLVTEGLPEVGRYAAMLDGNWEKWGWQPHEVMEK
ncbi:type VI secretion system-associated protein TagF [Aliikangiella maris]|uniref:Type VI secretion system-associated protein TagF n=2 Tax=Aliikangiella maris TaxID=3162458 RepID=A0ABV3MN95_9GAMM